MAENWALIKAQYELLNHDVDQIAFSNNVSKAAVEYAIETKGWQRQDLSEALDKLENGTEDTEGLIESLALVKESHLLPQYITVETALLAKIQEMIDNIPLGLPIGADMLQKIETTFTSLAKTQSLLARSRSDSAAPIDTGLKILIQNRFEGDHGETSRSEGGVSNQAIEVSNVSQLKEKAG